MDQNCPYPSLPVTIKDIRFLLRRINRCIRDIDDSSLPEQNSAPQASAKISNLIHGKAEQVIKDRQAGGIYYEANKNDYFDGYEDNIFNELIKQ